METVFIAVEEGAAGRLDVFLAGELRGLSRSALQKLIEAGHVTKDGKACKSREKVSPGDLFAVELPEPEPLDVLPEDMALDVLYEDNDLIVINKPKGLVVHPAAGHITGTLVNALLHHCGSGLSGINGLLRPGIVHRIDKDTSGVIVAAKSDAAHKGLSEQLAAHSMTRVYAAVVHGGFTEEAGTVDRPINRHPADRLKMATVLTGGKRAVTHYRVLERLGKYTLLECRLETGRTHQIRVHLSAIGHPLLGDTVYGGKKDPFKLNGQALHAKTLGFVHPVKEEYMEFSAPFPSELEGLLQKLRNG